MQDYPGSGPCHVRITSSHQAPSHTPALFHHSRKMENKAMYLHTFSERENGSIFEEPFEGRNLSKLNLCEDGE